MLKEISNQSTRPKKYNPGAYIHGIAMPGTCYQKDLFGKVIDIGVEHGFDNSKFVSEQAGLVYVLGRFVGGEERAFNINDSNYRPVKDSGEISTIRNILKKDGIVEEFSSMDNVGRYISKKARVVRDYLKTQGIAI